jgi:hypothetical protein
MTDLPPPPADELDSPWDDDDGGAEIFGTPEVGAVVAFVLAVCSFTGFGLMNGTPYIAPFLNSPTERKTLVAGAIVGAALALVPVIVAWRVIARTLDDDPPWIVTLARTAVILGLASSVLRLFIAVLTAFQDDPGANFRL